MFAGGNATSNALSSPDRRHSPSVVRAVGERLKQRLFRVQQNGNLSLICWCVVVGFTSCCFRANHSTIIYPRPPPNINTHRGNESIPKCHPLPGGRAA